MPTKFMFKFGLIFLSVSALLGGCGRSHKKNTPPCDVGTNVSVCAADVREHTTWTESFKISQTDPKTSAEVPGSARQITVSYEFFPGQTGAEWKRSMLIEDQTGAHAMTEGGLVKAIDGSTFLLNQSHSTCDDPKSAAPPFDIRLYYQRNGRLLQVDTQKIEPIKAKGLFDVFGQMMTSMMALSIRAMLESAFSFGNASHYLESGHGTLNFQPTSIDDVYRAKSVNLGCFSMMSGFIQPQTAPPTK